MAESVEVEFAGETFRVVEPSFAALADLAESATAGADSNDAGGLIALKELLRDCVVEEDWGRFWALIRKSRAGGQELMVFVQKAVEALSERPTGQPSDSSAGLTPMPQSSEAACSLRVVAREEAAGRPDRALMVLLAHEAQTA